VNTYLDGDAASGSTTRSWPGWKIDRVAHTSELLPRRRPGQEVRQRRHMARHYARSAAKLFRHG